MSKKPILYMHITSPPCRAVLLTAAAIGLELEHKIINYLNAEQKSPEYIKLNPQHTVPLLDDNGVHIADSHAICAYLSEKYGKDDRFYPKDLVKRAQIDARLHFDSGHLFARLRFLLEPSLYYQSSKVSQKRIKYVGIAWDILERYLADTPYVCGNDVTIADFCLVATATSLTDFAPLDPVKHVKIAKWIERMAQLPYYEEANGKGTKEWNDAVRSLQEKYAGQ